MEGRIVPSIRRVKNQRRDGGLEAQPGHYALMFTVLPISPYTQITVSKNNKYFHVTVAVVIVYIRYMSIPVFIPQCTFDRPPSPLFKIGIEWKRIPDDTTNFGLRVKNLPHDCCPDYRR